MWDAGRTLPDVQGQVELTCPRCGQSFGVPQLRTHDHTHCAISRDDLSDVAQAIVDHAPRGTRPISLRVLGELSGYSHEHVHAQAGGVMEHVAVY